MKSFISTKEISDMVAKIAADMNGLYGADPLVAVCILKGSSVFFSDLIRQLTMPLSVDFMQVSSYQDMISSGVVDIRKDITIGIRGKDVVIVEDILDTGLTCSRICDILKQRQPASVRIAALLHKPLRTQVDIVPDFLGGTIDDVFVVGYGMDYNEQYRQLPDIRIIDPRS